LDLASFVETLGAPLSAHFFRVACSLRINLDILVARAFEKQLTDPASAHGRQYKEETMVNEPEFCRRSQGGPFGNR